MPDGAIVVTVAFRRGLSPRSCHMECSQFGKGPRIAASSSLATRHSSLMNPIIFSASATAASLLYGISSSYNMSAHPITPRPTRRLPCFTIWSIASRGKLLASTMSSKKRMDRCRSLRRKSQSISLSGVIYAFSLMLPRTQASYGSKGCSPHGLVVFCSSTLGVGFVRLMRSRKMMPGSPLSQAL